MDAPGKDTTFKISKTQILPISSAQCEQISKLLTPSRPRGSIGVSLALSSMIFERSRLFAPKRCISTPLKHQKFAFLDHLRIFRAAAPPANPQIYHFYENSIFWHGRFNPGGNYAVPDSVQKNSQPSGVAIDRKGIMMRARTRKRVQNETFAHTPPLLCTQKSQVQSFNFLIST